MGYCVEKEAGEDFPEVQSFGGMEVFNPLALQDFEANLEIGSVIQGTSDLVDPILLLPPSAFPNGC